MKIKATRYTILKRRPVDSTKLEAWEKVAFPQNSVEYPRQIKEGGHNHWLIEVNFMDEPDRWTWLYAYKPDCEIALENLISYYHFKECFKYAAKKTIDEFFQPFNNALREYHINSPYRIAAFIAQVAHESGSLRYTEELATGTTYEFRKDLGNIYRGDGKRFKGRGLIQLTGRNNYKWASRRLNLNLVKKPELAANTINSCRIAALYWHSRNLNKYADWNNIKGFRIITRRINGGYNGYSDRLSYWKHSKQVLGIL